MDAWQVREGRTSWMRGRDAKVGAHASGGRCGVVRCGPRVAGREGPQGGGQLVGWPRVANKLHTPKTVTCGKTERTTAG